MKYLLDLKLKERILEILRHFQTIYYNKGLLEPKILEIFIIFYNLS